MCHRLAGERVGVSLFWGWSGGCLPVLGVTGRMCHRFGGGRVGVSLSSG
jgi:hypothetical protein